MAIRLLIIENHYRTRLGVGRRPAWPVPTRASSAGGPRAPAAARSTPVRAALDDDLDVPDGPWRPIDGGRPVRAGVGDRRRRSCLGVRPRSRRRGSTSSWSSPTSTATLWHLDRTTSTTAPAAPSTVLARDGGRC